MKWILHSKTFWFNFLDGLVAFAQWYSGTHPIPADVQAIVTAVVNVWLRTRTTQPVSLTKPV